MIEIDLSGKRGLVLGVANSRSLGWAIAERLAAAGAELAFGYQGERLKEELEKLTAGLPGSRLYQCDVTREEELAALFADLTSAWGSLDYVVHSIAFAPRTAMDGRYIETTRDDWRTALEISAYSLVAVARAAEPLLAPGGGLVTLTYYAAEKVVPKYNVMGVAKSALEASVRYLAYELGSKGVRVNAVSAGPVRTVAARSIPGFLKMYNKVAGIAPLGRNVTHEEVGNLGLFLLSPMASGITGETVYVDGGFHVMGLESASSVAAVSALILAGGSGTRFWPLSRRLRPKQLLALEGEGSLLRDTVDRLAPLIGPESVWICTTEALADAVRQDLPEVPPEQVLAEPLGRNTAPALGWAVGAMPEAARQGAIAVLPADHRVGDPAAFRESIAAAAEVALRERRIMTLGVTPHRPETGYGYLELEAASQSDPSEAGGSGVRRVHRFVEKPDAARAAVYASSGHHLWNAGIFVFQGDDFLTLLARHAPEIAAGLAAIAEHPARLAELYAALPSISIDYALMEKLDTLGTLPLDCGWSDLGSWEALSEVLPQDHEGNAVRGEAVAIDAGDNLLVAEEGTIAVLGVSGLVVVRTGDTVLVCPKERSQEVRRILDELAARGRGDLL